MDFEWNQRRTHQALFLGLPRREDVQRILPEWVWFGRHAYETAKESRKEGFYGDRVLARTVRRCVPCVSSLADQLATG